MTNDNPISMLLLGFVGSRSEILERQGDGVFSSSSDETIILGRTNMTGPIEAKPCFRSDLSQ
jgi:hypothetical protein